MAPKKKVFDLAKAGSRAAGGGRQAPIDLDDQPERSPAALAGPPRKSPFFTPRPATAGMGVGARDPTTPTAEPPPKARKTSDTSSPAASMAKLFGGSPAKAKAKQESIAVPKGPQDLPQINDAKHGLPLQGIVMAFTGELDSMTRQDAEEKCKSAGAKVMGSVSGNTQYLVMGSHLDDGRQVTETSKYRKYLELKEKGKKCPELLDESQLLKLLPSAVAPPPVTQPLAASRKASDSGGAFGSGTSLERYMNWVDSHAPKSFGEVLGNASVVRKLTEWLRDWDNVVLKGRKKMAGFKPGGGMPDNINARAALVSGPPGIGKTTACRLVAQLHGSYEVLEYNASDARGQKIIQEMAQGIADNHTISFGSGLGQRKLPGLTKRAVLIMDEVDGMGAGDRGGGAALIKMIKKTRNPIICICNDAHSQKVRNLAFSCYDLKFSRPTKSTVAQRCAMIARKEGLDVEENALEELAESCGSDMRQVLNQLQILAKSPKYQKVGVKYMDMKSAITKDPASMIGPFDACRKLLSSSEGARLSFRDRMDLYFVDHSLMGLLVHENYLNSVSKKPVDADLLNRCAYSADLMSVGDMMNAQINKHQQWSLLPQMGLNGCVYPAHVTNGFVGFPSFPAFLGKYSTQSRMRRLCTELHAHLKLFASVSRGGLASSGYPGLLYSRAVGPLLRGDVDAVAETAAALDAYGLRKEHLVEHLTEMRQHLGAEDLFKLVDPKVKAAMTREFNSGCHAVKVMLPKSNKRKASSAALDTPDGLDDDEDGAEAAGATAEQAADDDDDEAGGSMVKVKGKAKSKAKGKAKAKAEGDSRGSPAKAKGGRGRNK